MKDTWKQVQIFLLVILTVYVGILVIVNFDEWSLAGKALGIILLMGLCGADFGWLIQYPFWTVVKDFHDKGIKGVKILR